MSSRAIHLPAEAAEGAYDPEGLPLWAHDPAAGYEHGDLPQILFALACMDYGFHLPEFDLWLSKQPSSANKSAFMASRAKAFHAFLANDDEAMALHLSVLDARQAACAVWPDARSGHKSRVGGSKGGSSKKTPEWHVKAVEHARLLLATGKEPHELASVCARKFGKSEDQARKVLQSAELVPKRNSRM